MTKPVANQKQSRLIRDRILWAVAEDEMTAASVYRTVTETGVSCSRRAIEENLNALNKKGLVKKTWGGDNRYWYKIAENKKR